MIKSILVPMGTSKSSLAALKVAVNLSNLFKGTLKLLYVEDEEKMRDFIQSFKATKAGYSYDSPKKERNKILEEFEKEVEQIKSYYNQFKDEIKGKHSLEIKVGELNSEILNESMSADLVIKGNSPRKIATESIHKSVFDFIKRTNTPMLAVCDNNETLGKNFLLTYDSSRSANNAMKILGDFIPIFNPTITVLSVHDKEQVGRRRLEEAEKYFAAYGVTVDKIWRKSKIMTQIEKIVKEKEISTLVIGGYGDNKVKEFFMGSTTETVLNTIKLPVIVSNA